MVSTQGSSQKPMQFRSLFYGLWLGPFMGVICVELGRSMLYGNSFWFELQSLMRSIGIVYLHAAAIGYPLFLLLVRYDKLHFVGFTCAGIVAGVTSSILYLIAHRVLNWFSDISATSMAYVFCSAVIVAWAVWAVSWVAEFIYLRDGAAR